MKIKLRFQRNSGFEEQMKILKRPYGDHEGYPRENDGTWIITDADGNGAVRVTFRGKAKRGQGWNAPDPEGQELARRVVAAFNACDGITTARLEEYGHGGLSKALWGKK